MDFKTAIQTCLQKYVDFKGRARRAEFWWFALFSVLCQLVGELLGGDIIGGLVSLALLLPSITVGVRRLQDTGRVGWWLLIALIPVVGFFVLLYFFTRPGDVGPNDYGADPISGDAAPSRKPRGPATEFDRVMDDSYQKSRVPRSGDSD